MMRVIIIEDEAPAAKRLEKMLLKLNPGIQVIQKLDSVEASIKYLQTATAMDLIFMDIQLADGVSFNIFKEMEVPAPVIFTTAYDQYALQAFKVNSIDYLLKPIDEKELHQAVAKYEKIHQKKEERFSEKMLHLLAEINTTKYKERILIKRGQQLSYLKTENIAYCYADGKFCYAIDSANNKYLLEFNLAQLEEQLPIQKFYRINRTLLVNIDAIHKVHTWLGGRLKLELIPGTKEETIVSRERVNHFKEWLGGN